MKQQCLGDARALEGSGGLWRALGDGKAQVVEKTGASGKRFQFVPQAQAQRVWCWSLN